MATWAVTADVERFDEAESWFRKRVPVKPDVWDELTAEAKRKAFKVAGVAQLDLVAEVQAALQSAIDNGTSLEEFKASVATKLTNAWAGTVANPPARLDTIFRTNTQLAYSAGRYRQMSEPSVKKFRPYFLLDTILDSRTSPICNALSHPPVCLPQDDPFWSTHVPPLHHRCRSGLRALRKSQAEEEGITESAPDAEASDGFGARPGESEWEPDLKKYPSSLAAAFKKKKPPSE